MRTIYIIKVNLSLKKNSNKDKVNVKIQCYICFVLLNLEINEIIKTFKEEFRKAAVSAIEQFLSELDNVIIEELGEHKKIRFFNRTIITSLGCSSSMANAPVCGSWVYDNLILPKWSV